jgi:hypothetical protein
MNNRTTVGAINNSSPTLRIMLNNKPLETAKHPEMPQTTVHTVRVCTCDTVLSRSHSPVLAGRRMDTRILSDTSLVLYSGYVDLHMLVSSIWILSADT